MKTNWGTEPGHGQTTGAGGGHWTVRNRLSSWGAQERRRVRAALSGNTDVGEPGSGGAAMTRRPLLGAWAQQRRNTEAASGNKRARLSSGETDRIPGAGLAPYRGQGKGLAAATALLSGEWGIPLQSQTLQAPSVQAKKTQIETQSRGAEGGQGGACPAAEIKRPLPAPS